MKKRPASRSGRRLDAVRHLARFRYELRKFLYFSEKSARSAGITPQQHQLLLGVEGFTGRRWATISELAEFLQERHNAVVGRVDRACKRGLVSKRSVARDRRLVRVEVTPDGRQILRRLSDLHQRELSRLEGSAAHPGEPFLRSFSIPCKPAGLKIDS
ncbi:MAG: MarR family winged helix-turn-helix transcriptional regulator [Terriglobia bacterium]